MSRRRRPRHRAAVGAAGGVQHGPLPHHPRVPRRRPREDAQVIIIIIITIIITIIFFIDTGLFPIAHELLIDGRARRTPKAPPPRAVFDSVNRRDYTHRDYRHNCLQGQQSTLSIVVIAMIVMFARASSPARQYGRIRVGYQAVACGSVRIFSWSCKGPLPGQAGTRTEFASQLLVPLFPCL